jgi:hypothetical protein
LNLHLCFGASENHHLNVVKLIELQGWKVGATIYIGALNHHLNVFRLSVVRGKGEGYNNLGARIIIISSNAAMASQNEKVAIGLGFVGALFTLLAYNQTFMTTTQSIVTGFVIMLVALGVKELN